MSNKCFTTTILLLFFVLNAYSQCVHDQMVQNATKHFYNDLSDARLLAPAEEGRYIVQYFRLRIFVDYTQVSVGGATQINTIKRATNITASYFYRVLNVTRLQRLYYPKDAPLQCNSLVIPEKYVTEGAIGDIGVACGNVNDDTQVYVAKSIACAYLESTKRPYWGIMVWNNAFLKYDQEGFQQIVYVGIHQMTHILGFSAVMYDLYRGGSPLVQKPAGDYTINTPRINAQITKHFNCSNPSGLPLQDQDGTLIASHWERKILGNQMMIASNRKSGFTSVFTLALLESTGWYTSVDYTFAEPTTWGKNAGCGFLNIDECAGKEFCQDSEFGCDTDGTAIGRCSNDLFTGACKIIKYFTNTICVDENYQLKNLNAKLNALERGGSFSRCFKSDFREKDLTPSKLNNRCYISVCSFSKNFMYVLVGSYIIVCRTPGQVVNAPPGLDGTLTCPTNFQQYCKAKQICPYHCNKNGICVDGQCMCTGSTKLSQTCVDVSILVAPIGSTGGLLNALSSNNGPISIQELTEIPNSSESTQPKNNTRIIKKYSVYSKCIQGTVEDEVFGGCLKCGQVFNCQNCDESGCLTCDNGSSPNSQKRCPASSKR